VYNPLELQSRRFHVKHLDVSAVDYLRRLTDVAGIGGLTAAALVSMVEYLDALIETNTRINLTRIVEPEVAVRLHLADSLLALPAVAGAPDGALLDIGTGGGIPGVPLCIATGRRGVLLDSVAKKATAVAGILETVDPAGQITVVAARAEDYAREAASSFAVVTARAVSELPAIVELAAPFLMMGGRLVALKGAPELSELERGAAAATICGLTEIEICHLTVPEGTERRTIVVYEKYAQPTEKLPRRVGLAQKSPLA